MAETKLRLNQTDLNARLNKLTQLADGTNPNDAVNKGQLDAATSGSVSTSSFVTREVPSGTKDGVNTIFTLAFTPFLDTEHVYLNGLLLNSGASEDYTISGPTITFAVAPLSTDKILVSYLK